MSQNRIYQRINHYIKYLRKKLLNKDHLGQFKQFEFVKISPEDLDLLKPNKKQICTVKVLSSMEQNKMIADVLTYDLLLKKLNLSYVYRETNIETQDYLCQCLADLFFIGNKEVKQLRADILKHSKAFSHDFLWQLDLKAIHCILDWFETDKSLSRKDFIYLNEILYCLNENVQQILLHYFVYSSYIDPDIWPLFISTHDLIERRSHQEELLQSLKYLRSGNLLKLYKVYFQTISSINKVSYLYKSIEKFRISIELMNRRSTLSEEAYLDQLFSLFETSNKQFVKAFKRVYLAKKYDKHDTRYLHEHFLIHEPYPRHFSTLLFRRTLEKINQVKDLREFIAWYSAHFY